MIYWIFSTIFYLIALVGVGIVISRLYRKNTFYIYKYIIITDDYKSISDDDSKKKLIDFFEDDDVVNDYSYLTSGNIILVVLAFIGMFFAETTSYIYLGLVLLGVIITSLIKLLKRLKWYTIGVLVGMLLHTIRWVVFLGLIVLFIINLDFNTNEYIQQHFVW